MKKIIASLFILLIVAATSSTAFAASNDSNGDDNSDPGCGEASSNAKISSAVNSSAHAELNLSADVLKGISKALEDGPVLLYFYTEGCPECVKQAQIDELEDFYTERALACKEQAQIIDKLEAEYAGKVTVIRIDVDKVAPDIFLNFMVLSAPSTYIIADEKEDGKFQTYVFWDSTEETNLNSYLNVSFSN